MTTANGTTLTAARAYLAAGLSLLPVRLDGSKAPALATWKRLTTELPLADEIEEWFADDAAGIGVVGGKISGGLETLDFDIDADVIFTQWVELVEIEVPGLLLCLSVARTPKPGYHVRYRVSGAVVPGNLKLAISSDGMRCLIETRGEGGYAIAPGSPAACHITGGLYAHYSGPRLSQVQTITAPERDILIRCCRSFNRAPTDESPRTPSSGLLPGHDYNARGPDWAELLEPHGWTLVHQRDGVRYWSRPGKKGTGWSATTGACTSKSGSELFAVFSSNASPFIGPSSGRPCSVHDRFGVYTFLNHGGDFTAAAHALRNEGYGERQHQQHATTEPYPATATPWPDPPDPAAYHGLAGEIIRLVEPHTEADPVALLVQLLVGFGAMIGRDAYFAVEGDRHAGNEYAVLVGTTSKARKGTSWSWIRHSLNYADTYFVGERIQGGLSSGEGLIWAVRDPITKSEPVKEKGRVTGYQNVEVDAGVYDKRLLVAEPEFASVLRQIERQGNTLSCVLRQAWEGGQLRILTKNNPAKATDAHIAMIGHITVEELRRYMSATESANGFANRYIWICVRRSKALPDGGQLDMTQLVPLNMRLADAATSARQAGRLQRDPQARDLWHAVYPELSEGKPGLAGALLARGEAHVVRLAMIYALLDGETWIRRAHLEGALALWRFSESSVRYIFGDSIGDPVADEILRLLRGAGTMGVTRNEIREYFGRNKSSDQIGRALGLLLEYKLARFERQKTDGRPAERWFLGT